MKAIGYNQAGPITAPDALIEFEAQTPELGPSDLLVEVRGMSVNPVDVKVRAIMVQTDIFLPSSSLSSLAVISH